MPTTSSFDYAIIRVVPRVERGEFINAGVVLFCRTLRFLDARVDLDEQRLLALAPGIDLAGVQQHLGSIARICRGGREAGPIGLLPQTERFHWLTAPRSAIIQTSPVHTGTGNDPKALLEQLLDAFVRPLPPPAR